MLMISRDGGCCGKSAAGNDSLYVLQCHWLGNFDCVVPTMYYVTRLSRAERRGEVAISRQTGNKLKGKIIKVRLTPLYTHSQRCEINTSLVFDKIKNAF